ncbi:helix-turn-helix domain-containing protein [Actinoallomurus purpureus]|uniref:helix-turn-helix domain-containing protein n=1 Tax=Actinoallomurus purpureus TaxID=478114 RepID=UPI0020923967|nr:helix-turn-helix transcriptional regulator [Actinoallomurus purpureus]MCO6005518.1 helix-turn-helix domain-containing protein [Actinoallomurus purpureus]
MSQHDEDLVSATVRRWQLTESLKQLREQAGMTIEQAVNELSRQHARWSRPKLSRIENRHQGVKPRDVEQLLDLYKVDEKTRKQLLDLAQTANERGWWLTYRRDLPEDFHPLFTLEIAATGVRQFETLLIPGLLQTGDYARAVVSAVTPDLSGNEIDRRVAARLARQQILSRNNPPELHIILDQGILERPIGQPKTMRGQLLRLVEASDTPNTTVQILTKDVGATAGLEGPFSILSLPEPIPDVGYTEGVGGAVYLESVEDVRRCTLRFGMLIDQALPPNKSVDLIASAAGRLG